MRKGSMMMVSAPVLVCSVFDVRVYIMVGKGRQQRWLSQNELEPAYNTESVSQRGVANSTFLSSYPCGVVCLTTQTHTGLVAR